MFWWIPFGQVPEVEPQTLAEWLAQGQEIQLIDVRTRWEFEHAHIEGACLVPIHTLKRQLASLTLDMSKPVIAICKTAHRSIPAVRLLKEAGYDAQQLAGGMDAWQKRRIREG